VIAAGAGQVIVGVMVGGKLAGRRLKRIESVASNEVA
jgi:uncharacterized membrane protein AbrB (regulator of aidB expression)